MKAVVLEKPGQLTVKDIPMRVCKADEVLVKVRACGICGSDLKYYKGQNPWTQHTLGKNMDSPPNMVIGHEFTGEVVEAGDPVYSYLIGKRVFAQPYNTCGMCEFCKTGRYNLCRQTKHIGHGAGWEEMDYYPGGMAEFCPVWATHAYELPDHISFEEATFLDPLAVSIHAVNRSGFKPGCDVLILGSGPIGLCIMQVVKAFGCARVFCTDVYDRALKIAADTGADYLMNVNNTDVVGFVMEKTKNRGVDLVFDTVGSEDAQHTAFKLLACSGTLVNLVSGPQEITIKLQDLSGERSIIGSSNDLYEDVLTGMKLMASGRVQTKPLITHRLPLQEVDKGFHLLLDKINTGAVKIIVFP